MLLNTISHISNNFPHTTKLKKDLSFSLMARVKTKVHINTAECLLIKEIS